MKVLINAISIDEGGGLIVLKKMIENFILINSNIKWYVAIKKKLLPHIPISTKIIYLSYSFNNITPFYFIYWYEIKLPILIYKIRPDVLFSLTNFLPKRKLPCKTLLLIHQAGYFSKKFQQLYTKKYKMSRHLYSWNKKIKLAKKSIKYASFVTVQTQTLADEIITQEKVRRSKLFVIPHGPGLAKLTSLSYLPFPVNTIWRIGYITKYGVQKDFETAIKAMFLLKKQNIQFKFILTLDKHDKNNNNVLNLIRYYNLENEIENNENIENEKIINNLYQSLHIFIFPSLCESFGFSLVEAMAHGLPIVASDIKNNREVANQSAHYFTPENAEELANKIYSLMINKRKYESLSKNSIASSAHYCWNKTAKNILSTFYHILEKN